MILLKEQPINFVQQDAIMLEVENGGGYIYLSKNTYDQVVVLNDRFEGEIGVLKKVLGTDATHHESVTWFYNNAPEPLSILAPFIALIRPDVPVKRDLKLLCGMLHQMSMMIDFNEFTKVPQEVRANVQFTRAYITGFDKSWDDIEVKIRTADIVVDDISVNLVKMIVAEIMQAMPVRTYEETVPVVSTKPNKRAAVVETEPEDIEEEVEEEEEEEEDIWAEIGKAMAEAINNPPASGTFGAPKEEEHKEIIEEPAGDDKSKEMSQIDDIIKLMSGGK